MSTNPSPSGALQLVFSGLNSAPLGILNKEILKWKTKQQQQIM